ncbi:MAG: phosphatase PAP2 family protein [Alphaproteobacteria bacterium]
MIKNKIFEILTSLRFFFLVVFLIIFFFNFLDIFLFELTRTFHGNFFIFFKDIIDPLSDIFDPLNVIISCFIVLVVNLNIQSILRNNKKLEVIKLKTNFKAEKIFSLYNYIGLVSKHFIYSLTLAGILCNVFKYFFGVSRPKYFFLEDYERINFFNLEHKVSSFPSGHTQAAFTLAILLIIYLNRFTLFILMIAVLLALSRIFMSMHFPSDLIAGAYLGSIVPIIIYNIYFKCEIEDISKKYRINLRDLLKLLYYRINI